MENKLIVIVGPTASGKSDLAVKIAKKIGGEVISADSRQIYAGMDIGSGKITKKEMMGIPHHLLGVANPRRQFSVARFKKLANEAIKKIRSENKVPILCGGTGLYIQSVVDGILIPEVKPNFLLRSKLSRKTTAQLYEMLKKMDPRRAGSIDKFNPRRLIRAIEIIKTTGDIVPELKKKPLPYPVLIIGIKISQARLAKLIKKRLLRRISGLIAEVKKLRASGLSYRRLESFGLEYRFAALYLQKKISRLQMIEMIQNDSNHYAKRQMTWFRRDSRINWVNDKKKTVLLTLKYLSR